jgi:hypothetical protein
MSEVVDTMKYRKKGDTMSSNYPEGSMRGSGIYADNYTGDFYCYECDEDYELDGVTDDWGNKAFATCPKCEADLELELPDNEPDPDAMYDAWRESQMGD